MLWFKGNLYQLKKINLQALIPTEMVNKTQNFIKLYNGHLTLSILCLSTPNIRSLWMCYISNTLLWWLPKSCPSSPAEVAETFIKSGTMAWEKSLSLLIFLIFLLFY